MDALAVAHGLPVPQHEVYFALPRKFRWDHAWAGWLALEEQGGLFIGGRHSRGAALRDEYEKLREGLYRGWSVMFCLPEDVRSGRVFEWVKRALQSREAK